MNVSLPVFLLRPGDRFRTETGSIVYQVRETRVRENCTIVTLTAGFITTFNHNDVVLLED